MSPIHDTPTNIAETAVRKPYEAPVLVEYGTLSALTQAGGASQVEGQTPIPNKKP
jgi:hypothetical protein